MNKLGASVFLSQEIIEPEGVSNSVLLTGNKITLINDDGEIFHFPARLIPELIGTLHDMDNAYGKVGG